ncbi:SH3 domain-containing protein [Marilutibacter chinensis]|uniref:SH3 domain-containing protein n=1 Tax=Marilutibacter chinensis TaxID=2912247 RepID=A0ABS9HW63_9GAMM|nr:SH3 domain-containing protein [Lysobacter chinensis]MCF7223135.1 SH3 domain-containing protein [Lysobacter chinensis]
MRAFLFATASTAFLATMLAQVPAAAFERPRSHPVDDGSASTGIAGVQVRQLDPEFWVSRLPAPDRQVLDRAAIERQNLRLFVQDDSVHDLDAFPARLTRAEATERIRAISSPPTRGLFNAEGERFDDIDALESALALGRIPEPVVVRHGLVVRRADMRSYPTTTRVFSSPGDTDIDRFQETALFPGTPLAILHESRDGEWWFAVSPRYGAWIRKQYVALGGRDEVLGYRHRTPYLVVTGATVETVYTPEEPRVSGLQLDMGVRVPLLADWPADRPVNGQAAYAGHVIELPVRDGDGRLRFVPALLPRTRDVAADYLPLTQANLLRQGFKFLGERYGWGHAYNARDCSGFVSEVYRSFGVQLPRNTSAQGVSPAFNTVRFGEDDDRESRLAVLRTLQPGDLVYIPGHVMMVIGQYQGAPYVIHDVTGITLREADGSLRRVALNGVSVTPLEPLQAGEDATIVDRIYSIQKIRPSEDGAPELRP